MEIVSASQIKTNIQVTDVNLDLSEEDETMQDDSVTKYRDHPIPSINYGINGRGTLSEAPHADPTKCLPFDIMHILN